MTDIKVYSANLAEILKPEGFIRKGNAFFLIKGDVFIVIKIERERTSIPGHPHYRIDLGLFSMLSEYLPQHFTERGCIPRYEIVNLVGERMSMGLRRTNNYTERGYRIYIPYEITTEEQISILSEKGLPFIRSINSQEELFNAICQLDEVHSGRYYGLDMHKYAPLLAMGRNKDAEDIIRKLLQLVLNKIPEEDRNDISSVMKHIKEDWRKESTRKLYNEIELAENNDAERIRGYLNDNYRNNIAYAKEKLKWKGDMVDLYTRNGVKQYV